MHLQVAGAARLRAVEHVIGDGHVTRVAAGAEPVRLAHDGHATAHVTAVVAVHAAPDTHAAVERAAYDDNLVVGAVRGECLTLAVLSQLCSTAMKQNKSIAILVVAVCVVVNVM